MSIEHVCLFGSTNSMISCLVFLFFNANYHKASVLDGCLSESIQQVYLREEMISKENYTPKGEIQMESEHIFQQMAR